MRVARLHADQVVGFMLAMRPLEGTIPVFLVATLRPPVILPQEVGRLADSLLVVCSVDVIRHGISPLADSNW